MLRTGIKSLAVRVIGKSVQKPKKVSMSRWDNPWLYADQVKYATVDAFVSFEIGRRLYSIQNQN
ncbi:werner syndrome-like exonuclease-like protein [Trifolium pratense]|nr:werner syndrome-like exonuclease-like protein [Trifolium pratense]